MKNPVRGSPATGELHPQISYDLIRRHARRLARETSTHHLFADLVQYGALGVADAGQRYDPNRGVRFLSYARHRLAGAMRDGLRAMLPLSRRALGEAARRQEESECFAQSVRDIAMSFYLEATVDWGQLSGPEESLIEKEDATRLRAALQDLAEDERVVVEAIYDFHGIGDSGAQLALRRGVSRSCVSRAHQRVLRTLAAKMNEPDHG